MHKRLYARGFEVFQRNKCTTLVLEFVYCSSEICLIAMYCEFFGSQKNLTGLTVFVLGIKQLAFENKILRQMCGPLYDTELNMSRRRKNTEPEESAKVSLKTNLIKCQKYLIVL